MLPKRGCFRSQRIGPKAERLFTLNMYLRLFLVFVPIFAYAAPHVEDLYTNHDLVKLLYQGSPFLAKLHYQAGTFSVDKVALICLYSARAAYAVPIPRNSRLVVGRPAVRLVTYVQVVLLAIHAA